MAIRGRKTSLSMAIVPKTTNIRRGSFHASWRRTLTLSALTTAVSWFKSQKKGQEG
jgi:hypothetical protein